MDVILIIFGMSYAPTDISQPPEAPQAVVVEVIKFQPKKDELDQYSWLTPRTDKKFQ